MTVNVQIPVTRYLANGETVFVYDFGIVEDVDLTVWVNDVLQTQYSAYVLENQTDVGGDVVFAEAPTAGSVVVLLRSTTRSQNVDYESYDSFPAETHEWGMDKITYILQEEINGGFQTVDDEGNIVFLSFDLSATAADAFVTINNSGGTPATIPSWQSGVHAGVFHGEIVGQGESPEPDTATTKPDGFVWFEVEQ